jgi:type IV secretion system protein VirB10
VNEEEREPEGVSGERDTHSVARFMSAQSRVSNILAAALMSLLGLGALTWYYANTVTRSARARETAQAAASQRAQGGDAPLPSLGRVVPPAARDLPEPPVADPPAAARMLTEIAVEPAAPSVVSGGPPPKSEAELALERELSGAVFASHRAASDPGTVVAGNAANPSGDRNSGDFRSTGGPPGVETGTLLRPLFTTAVQAQRLPEERLLLPKGAFIDCTLETAIDSTLPGMTTCIMAADTFGVDGKVVLMERGTKLVGETRGQVQQGSARIFVIWTEARTPAGVIVPLDSQGADELGRAGLPGEVNRHFWQRFGAAMLVSVIDGAVQAAVQSSRSSSGTVVVNPSASQDVLTEILKNTVGIPPTVIKRNGDRIQVLVARDLDFRSVYELRSASGR